MKIDLLPRKEFEITLESGAVIKGKFGVWGTIRFSKKQGYTNEDLQRIIESGMSASDKVEFLLCAIEQKARETKQPFSFTDVDCCMWIDEMGGLGSDIFKSIFTHAGDETEETVVEESTEEKKTEAIV